MSRTEHVWYTYFGGKMPTLLGTNPLCNLDLHVFPLL